MSFSFPKLSTCLCLLFFHGYASPTAQASESAKPEELSKHLSIPQEQAGFNETQVRNLIPLANMSEQPIQYSATLVKSKPAGLQAIKINLKNISDRPLVFDGENATIKLVDSAIQSAAMKLLEDGIKEPDNPRGYGRRSFANTISAAVTVGAVQTVEGEIHLLGPIDRRYGFDNERRREREQRFGKRLLFPGDSSEGIIYVKTKQNLEGKQLQIPVAAFYNPQDKCRLNIELKN